MRREPVNLSNGRLKTSLLFLALGIKELYFVGKKENEYDYMDALDKVLTKVDGYALTMY